MKINTLLQKIFAFSCFMIMGVLSLSAQGQNITLPSGPKTVAAAFEAIERQTSMTIAYNDSRIDVTRSFNDNVTDRPLSDALATILRGTGATYRVQGNRIIIVAASAQQEPGQTGRVANEAQGRTITGRVSDASGSAIVGAMVTVQGTSTTAITDNSGAFSLRVPANGTISVSFYGYTSQNVNVGSQTVVNVILQEDAQVVEDVVVVGYGVQKKETLSGAVSAITADAIVTTKTNNVISNLQGKMAGLLIRQQSGQPGMFDNAISIRGFGTPLIVIDGVSRGSNADASAELAQLNSDDIASVSILKDGAAAIYGMNASNGAILVTTKRGAAGKTSVSYSGMVSVKRPTGMEWTISGPEYMRMENEMDRNDGNPMLWTDKQIAEATDTDWGSIVLKNSVVSHSHNISVSGGNDKVQYFVSGSYSGDPGLLTTDVMYYKRYNFRSNVTAQLTRDVKMNVSFSGYRSDRGDSSEGFASLFKTIFVSERYVGVYAKGSDPADRHWSRVAPEGQNPLARITPDANGKRRWETFNGVGQIDLTYTAPFLEGLSFKAMADYNYRVRNDHNLSRFTTYYDYNLGNVSGNNGRQDSYQNEMRIFTKGYFQLNANYIKSIGNHNIAALLAGEGSMTRNDQLMGRRQFSDLYTHDIINQGTATTAANSGERSYGRLAAYLAKINYDYAGKYLVEVTGRYDGSYRYAPEKRWAFFPAASVGWRISEESFIKDNLPWMSNLKLRASYGEMGRDQGDDFQYVPGYVGSNARGALLGPGAFTIGYYPPGVVNRDMSWVTTSLLDVGLDFDMKGGAFGFSLDFFKRKNSGVLGTRQESVPNFFGASFPEVNINSDMNIGLELEVRHRGKIGNEFNYSVTANTTYARQKVLHNERAPWTTSWDKWRNMNSVENRLMGRSFIHTANGQYTDIKEFQTEVLYGGALGNSKMLPGEFRIRDTDGDGVITDKDKMPDGWAYGNEGFTSGNSLLGREDVLTRVNPPLQYGLSFMGEWRGISLSFLFQGAALYTINFRSQDPFGYGRYESLHTKYLDRWHTAGGVADDPYDPATQWIPGTYAPMRRWVNGGGEDNSRVGTQSDAVTKMWRPRGDYLRLKNLEVGYELPQSILKQLRVSRLRVFVNMTNILTFANRNLRNIDPEQQETDYAANMTYPIMKDINFGVNLNF